MRRAKPFRARALAGRSAPDMAAAVRGARRLAGESANRLDRIRNRRTLILDLGKSGVETKAAQDVAAAADNLGRMYSGECGNPDYDKAREWWLKAAELGDGGACNGLGILYSRGMGVTPDIAQAVEWFRRGAERGNANAQHSLGWAYLHGQGVPVDFAQAERWLRSAASQDTAAAFCNLGMMYFEGNGVPQSDQEAVRLFQRSAELGEPQCQFNLGVAYRDGKTVPRDFVSAYVWFSIAALGEIPAAPGKANAMRQQLTAEQIEAAERRIAAWKPVNK